MNTYGKRGAGVLLATLGLSLAGTGYCGDWLQGLRDAYGTASSPASLASESAFIPPEIEEAVACLGAKTYKSGKLTVVYDNEVDLRSFLSALESAKAFFKPFGYDYDAAPFAMNAYFSKVVVHPTKPDMTIYGYHNTATSNLYMTGFDPENTKKMRILKHPMTYEMHEGAMVHEIAHLYLTHFNPYSEFNTAAHEYIAYACQIAGLPEDLRETILSSDHYKDVGAFKSDAEINDWHYKVGFNEYGIKSYRHYVQTKGSYIVRMIETDFSPLKEAYEFFRGWK